MVDSNSSRPLIAAEEAESYRILAGAADAGLVLVCDHAENAFPPGYGTLGLPEDQLRRHIAYDIGAAAVTRSLVETLGVPAILSRFSRLLIDPNRGADDPTLIMRLSDGAIIPGNRILDDAERARRTRLYYEPYHQAIDRVLDRCIATGVTPAIVSVHSFTESWKRVPRPWHVGILWHRDTRLAAPLLEAFYAEGDLIVGDNEPYAGQLEGDCMWQHATQRGLAWALIELRQDLIRDSDGQAAWSDRLARILQSILGGGHAFLSAQNAAQAHKERPAMSSAPSRTEIEAAVFRRLVEHLRTRADVQNIDLMNLAGFCRNCLSNWYQEAAQERGVAIGKDEARKLVYGMSYDDWKAKHQREATPEQKSSFEKSKPHSH